MMGRLRGAPLLLGVHQLIELEIATEPVIVPPAGEKVLLDLLGIAGWGAREEDCAQLGCVEARRGLGLMAGLVSEGRRRSMPCQAFPEIISRCARHGVNVGADLVNDAHKDTRLRPPCLGPLGDLASTKTTSAAPLHSIDWEEAAPHGSLIVQCGVEEVVTFVSWEVLPCPA